MQKFVSGEDPFKVFKSTCAIAATAAGYQLQYSVDKETWTSYGNAVPAGENLLINGLVPYIWLRMKNNTSENVEVQL